MQIEEKEGEFDKEQNNAIQGLEKDSHLLGKSVLGSTFESDFAENVCRTSIMCALKAEIGTSHP